MDDYLNIYWGHDGNGMLSQSIWEDRGYHFQSNMTKVYITLPPQTNEGLICAKVYANTHAGC